MKKIEDFVIGGNNIENNEGGNRAIKTLMLLTAVAVLSVSSGCWLRIQGSLGNVSPGGNLGVPARKLADVQREIERRKQLKRWGQVTNSWIDQEIIRTRKQITQASTLKEKQEYLEYLRELVNLKGQELNVQQQEQKANEELWASHREIDFNVTTSFDRKSIIGDAKGQYTLDYWNWEEIPNKQDGYLLHLKLKHHKRERWTKNIQLKLYYNGSLLKITTGRGKTYSQVVNRRRVITFPEVKVSGGRLKNLQFAFAGKRRGPSNKRKRY